MCSLQIDYDELMADRADIIKVHEEMINFDYDIYMITWSPDPKQLPNADFEMQHRYSIDFLADFLKCVRCGLLCCEPTQRGNPHYHGWYQCASDYREKGRIVHVKTMQQTGDLKVNKIECKYRINEYTQKANALWYYKKDTFGSMLYYEDTIITKDSQSMINWEQFSYQGFFDRTIDSKMSEKLSTRATCMRFYKDSMNWFNEK